jgi:hypothetical protein
VTTLVDPALSAFFFLFSPPPAFCACAVFIFFCRDELVNGERCLQTPPQLETRQVSSTSTQLSLWFLDALGFVLF